MNKKLLNAKMAEYGDNGNLLSAAIGITSTTFSAKKNEKNGSEFTQSEIMAIKTRYNLTAEQVDAIFFDKKVP